MSIRERIYFAHHKLAGGDLGATYAKIKREDARGVPPDTTRTLLTKLLTHCRQSVPYYAKIMARLGNGYAQNPEEYLQQMPILTKDVVRAHFDRLKSADLARRKWYYDASSGSTGAPLRLIQDRKYQDRVFAIQLLFDTWAGHEFGEPEIYIWGSERDIIQGSLGWKMRLLNSVARRQWLNAFRMTEPKMRATLALLNARPPKLITSYPHPIYELARFAEREQIAVVPQAAIVTSAGMLYPFMRDKIESVFGCKVFDRYGSREVGDVAGECSAHNGYHVFPWTNYVEIVDDAGRPVPPGTEGRILVTSLANYAMPFVRYEIGDLGVLSARETCTCGRRGQILAQLRGRSVDAFKTAEGTIVGAEYFPHVLRARSWIESFQVIQRAHAWIEFKIVPTATDCPQSEIDEIMAMTRAVMGANCAVTFQFVPDIAPGSSGKYRYTLSEV